ncbi:aldehyde dehydrogenase [Testicularia cyperi]|uniref:Aldehyde dehydrogenase n=1 Tax=Testicularia cyperi TaxID=1882483 RepID=A0A317XJD4_9BASI|nr:aldehyde dehydrogenase [Testicularia cyperi]
MTVSAASQLLSGTFSHVINGKPYDHGGSAKMMDVLNPATEQAIAQVPVATKEVLDEAVDAAHKAFASWSKTTWDERAKLVSAWGQDYRDMIPELAKLLTAEQGKSAMFAKLECDSILPWFDRLANCKLGEEVIYESETHRAVQRYVPLGVAGLICPWNFPILLALWKVLQGVLTGNCVVLKPSPFTPLCDIRIIESAQKHFPPGVVQIIVGDDSLGPWITEHPRIQKISFTGSTATGRLVARSCAATLKRFTLELGGNDPNVVLPEQDDLAHVAQQVALNAFFNSGQVCIASKRIYVHEDIYDQFSQAVAQAAQNLKVGPGDQEGVMFGPVNNKMQYNKVGEFFKDSQDKGHKFLTGGAPTDGAGYFYPLSVVDNPPEDSKIVQEEPFGPIVPLLKWKDEDDLIRRVNDSEWGLGAIVWGSNLERVERIARQIESGTVWTNSQVELVPEVPFGGMKSSGIGAESGKQGLASYCALQVLYLPKAKV